MQNKIASQGETQTKEMAKTKKHPALAWLDTKLDTIADYCSHDITPQHLSRTFATALLRDPGIAKCSQESIFLAITNAARLGLDPTGERNSAHFIAYKNNEKGILELKLMIGYGGLISLIIRNTDIIDIQTEVVFKGEHFKFFGGTEQRLEHELDFQIRGIRGYEDVIAAYAVATFANGHKKAVVLSRMELNKAQASAKGAKSVWNYSPIEMAKKTPVRSMSKWLDIGPDFNEAIRISDDAEGHDFSRRATPDEHQSGVDSLRGRIAKIDDTPPTEPDEHAPEHHEPTNPKADDDFATDIIERMDAEANK